MDIQQITEMLSQMEADRKAHQARMEAIMKAGIEETMTDMGANQVKAEANLTTYTREEMKADQDTQMQRVMAEWRALRERLHAETEALNTRTKAAQARTEAIWSRTKAMRDKMTEAIPEEEEPSPQEATERIEKTQVELPTVEVSPDTRNKKLEEKSEQQEVPKEGPAEAHLECEGQGHKEWKSGAERQLVPMEEVTRNSSGTKKRPRGRRIAAGRHLKPTKLIQGDGESRRKLVAARRKVSRRATVAWHRRNIFKEIRTQTNGAPRQKLGAAGN
jgi:hypothetical protein